MLHFRPVLLYRPPSLGSPRPVSNSPSGSVVSVPTERQPSRAFLSHPSQTLLFLESSVNPVEVIPWVKFFSILIHRLLLEVLFFGPLYAPAKKPNPFSFPFGACFLKLPRSLSGFFFGHGKGRWPNFLSGSA